MSPPRLPRNQPLGPPRPEYVALGVLFFFMLLSQLQMPLSQFQSSRGVDTFRAPAVLLRDPQSETAKDYFYADQDLYDDVLTEEYSSDSRDARPLIGLTPPAIKWMEAYQFHNSQHKLEDEEEQCHDRTNRGSNEDMSEIIDDGEWCPELHGRKFLVVDWVDFCNEATNQHSHGQSGIEFLQEFVRNIAWAMVTQRTLLFREMGIEAEDEGLEDNGSFSSCEGEECAKRYDVSGCKGLARLDPWVPTYQAWKKEYGWDDSIVQMVKTPSKLEYDPSSESSLAESAKVILLEDPPPLSTDNLSSEFSITKTDMLLDFGMTYGMILDETILFKEDQLEELESSVDSFDDNTRTRRYAVQAVVARTSECPLEFEQPCVIYQIGPEAIGPSACKIEVATAEEDLSTYKAVLEILAKAGNAVDGVLLDPDLPVGAFLMSLLRYRGRLDVRNFQLKGCWGNVPPRHLSDAP
jgi:hypothetical protein